MGEVDHEELSLGAQWLKMAPQQWHSMAQMAQIIKTVIYRQRLMANALCTTTRCEKKKHRIHVNVFNYGTYLWNWK